MLGVNVFAVLLIGVVLYLAAGFLFGSLDYVGALSAMGSGTAGMFETMNVFNMKSSYVQHFPKRKSDIPAYDDNPEKEIPVIRASICNGGGTVKREKLKIRCIKWERKCKNEGTCGRG